MGIHTAIPLWKTALWPCVLSYFSCVWLLVTLWTVAQKSPGSFAHRILQTRILEWVAVPSAMGIPLSEGSNLSLTSQALAVGFSTTSTTWEAPWKKWDIQHFHSIPSMNIQGYLIPPNKCLLITVLRDLQNSMEEDRRGNGIISLGDGFLDSNGVILIHLKNKAHRPRYIFINLCVLVVLLLFSH